MVIELVSKDVLHAQQPESRGERCFLSNNDCVIPKLYISYINFYLNTNVKDFFNIEKLKNSLEKTLNRYGVLCGTMHLNHDGRMYVDLNNKGVIFEEARCSESLYDLEKKEFDIECIPSELTSTIGWNEMYIQPGEDMDHLYGLRFRLTHFTNNSGVSLGISFHHSLCDLRGIVMFMNDWASMSRSNTWDQDFVCNDRSLLSLTCKGVINNPEYSSLPPRKPLNGISINTVILRINKNSFKKLFDSFMGQLDFFTLNDLIVSVLWKCVCSARKHVLAHDKLKLIIFVDGRKRVSPKIPLNYLGCVIFIARIPFVNVEHLCEQPLLSIAQSVRSAINGLNDSYIRRTMKWLDSRASLHNLVQDIDNHFGPDFFVSNWDKFRMYDSDFGWGRPRKIRLTNGQFDGSSYVLPAPSGDPTEVEIFLSLDSVSMSKLLSDPFFQEYFYTNNCQPETS